MENPDPSKSAVGPSFISAANALANLYKKAATVEKEARDSGARSAYMSVMQWAAVKSRRNEKITTAEVIALCSSELVKIPAAAPSRQEDVDQLPSSLARPSPLESRQRTAFQQNPLQGGSGGDALVSDIRKLAVNPRKRQRISISETFIRACEDSGNGNLFSIGSTRDASPRHNEQVPGLGCPLLEDVDIREGRSVTQGNRIIKSRSARNNLNEKRRK